jgi:hypothetical protein
MKPVAPQSQTTQQHKLSALFRGEQLGRLFGRYRVQSMAIPRLFIDRFALFYIAIITTVLLTGCSGMRIVDSQVAAFSKLEALPAATSWRFERLPSQQSLTEVQAAQQIQLESMATQELAKWGFKPQAEKEGSAAKYSVQLSARIQRFARGPFDDPWGGHGLGLPGRDYVVTRTGRVIYLPVFPHLPPPWYVREVGLIIRDTADNRVVYETKAHHEGHWSDDKAVLPAMLTAAMQGFPKPPQGPRMVNIEIPR